MKLSTILQETAVAGSTATGNIATPPGAETPARRKKHNRHRQMIKRIIPGQLVNRISESSPFVRFDTSTAILFEDDTTDQMRKVIDQTNGKIDNAIKQGQVADEEDYTTSTFGLQDADGNIVKVKVKREQANEFETRLNAILSDTENKKEIAEIIYILKSDFDILDVDWAQPITEDDEVPQEDEEFETDEEGEGDDEDIGDQLDLEDGEGGDDQEIGLDDMEGDSPEMDIDLQKSTVELLQQVIDLLKKETESRSAEVDLKTTDLETEKQEREIARQQEIADMEKHEEVEKEEKKNERLMQRLAKFRSMQQGGGE